MEKEVIDELGQLMNRDGGILYPESVVSFAKDDNTALHDKFEWDNEKAGHAHRLWQARHLIKTYVCIEPSTEKPISVYVSLSDDRKDKGGYRLTVDVLSDEDLRQKLLSDSFKDFDYWRMKYERLNELSAVFSAMDSVKRSLNIV